MLNTICSSHLRTFAVPEHGLCSCCSFPLSNVLGVFESHNTAGEVSYGFELAALEQAHGGCSVDQLVKYAELSAGRAGLSHTPDPSVTVICNMDLAVGEERRVARQTIIPTHARYAGVKFLSTQRVACRWSSNVFQGPVLTGFMFVVVLSVSGSGLSYFFSACTKGFSHKKMSSCIAFMYSCT